MDATQSLICSSKKGDSQGSTGCNVMNWQLQNPQLSHALSRLLHQHVEWCVMSYFLMQNTPFFVANTECLFRVCRFLNAIQTNAQHLVRYLAVAAVVNKRRRNVMKDLMRLIEQESYQVSDPVTEFLQCLFTNYDFEGAQQKLQECEQVRLLIEFLNLNSNS